MNMNMRLLILFVLFVGCSSDNKKSNTDPILGGMWVSQVESTDKSDQDKNLAQDSSDEVYVYHFVGNELHMHLIKESGTSNRVQSEIGTYSKNKNILDVSVKKSSCLVKKPNSKDEYTNGSLSKKMSFEVTDFTYLKIKNISKSITFLRATTEEQSLYNEILSVSQTGCFSEGQFKPAPVETAESQGISESNEFSDEDLQEKL